MPLRFLVSLLVDDVLAGAVYAPIAYLVLTAVRFGRRAVERA